MASSREDTGLLQWFSPDRRAVIPLDAIHLPRRLRERLRPARFAITTNCAFGEVISACAAPRATERDSWINAEIVSLYTQLHQQGRAHSVEAWHAETGALVGGVYGVQVGGVFSAESKFCRPHLGGTDASKVSLAHLLLHLRVRGFTLLDAQVFSEHLAQFGCIEIRRAHYLHILQSVGARAIPWQSFDPAANLELLSVI